MKKTIAPTDRLYADGLDHTDTEAFSWQAAIKQEKPLTNYPLFSWQLTTADGDSSPFFEARRTISRPLFQRVQNDSRICPYGDEPAPIARIERTAHLRTVRNAFELSALRFELNPFPNKDSRLDNVVEGIPTALQPLYREKSLSNLLCCSDENYSGEGPVEKSRQASWLRSPTLSILKSAIAQRQNHTRAQYIRELVPLMNANPLDPMLHSQELSEQMVHDLVQYVKVQNSPYLFFDLMQQLERDIAIRQWRSFRAGHCLSAESAMKWVMTSWVDSNGRRRKKPITCPVGVPLGYMQSIRRKNQPFITQEFANHAHGAFNHWLQEHMWERFCACYPDRCQLSTSQFFKELGRRHLAFADAIYELHMPDIANPSNTNFWNVLQFYLPLMSPWP